jgi:hypothetical protein
MLHKYDTILHEVRRFFGLTHVEYCIMNTIAGLSLSQNWCALSNKELAETQDISSKYVGQICDKLFNAGLIITQSALGKSSLKKATKIWTDKVDAAQKDLKKIHSDTPEQSSHVPKNKVHNTQEQSSYLPKNKVLTSSEQSSLSYKNKKEENKEEKEREKEPLENSLSLSFDFFQSVANAFFTSGCTKKEPTKYKRNFAALCNIALGLSDAAILSEKTIMQYNASQNEINAINGEIKALQGSLDHFDKVREKAVKNSKDGYIPRLIEKIIINEEYKMPETVKEKADKVSPKISNSGQHQQDPPKDSFGEKCADLLKLHSIDAVQIAHRIAAELRLPKDEIILKAVEGFANWGKKENIVITNHEYIGEVVHQFCEFVKEKNRAK